MTKKQCKVYNDIKWKYASETGCSCDGLERWLEINHPEIYSFIDQCSYCSKYLVYDDEVNRSCLKCPLFKYLGYGCENEVGLYYEWFFAKTKHTRIKYATLLRKALQDS